MPVRRYREPIKNWPEYERPTERLQNKEADFLSDAQLLAVIIRTGDASKKLNAVEISNQVLKEFGSLRGILDATVTELTSLPGIGSVKACQVKAALELGRRTMAEFNDPGLTQFRTSEDVVHYYSPILKRYKKEIFKTILLDSRNKFIKEVTISEGSVNSSIVYLREVFRPAIKKSAASVLLLQNHPSGDPSPSQDDIEITKRLEKNRRDHRDQHAGPHHYYWRRERLQPPGQAIALMVSDISVGS